MLILFIDINVIGCNTELAPRDVGGNFIDS